MLWTAVVLWRASAEQQVQHVDPAGPDQLLWDVGGVLWRERRHHQSLLYGKNTECTHLVVLSGDHLWWQGWPRVIEAEAA